MAVLEKIRVKFGLAISIIIALALLSFIIDPGTLESAVNTMSSKYNVGKIAGKAISYTDFQEDINRYTTINEIITGSTVQNEQIQNQIRDAAWQENLDQFMFLKNAKNAGITLGEEEIIAITTGEYASPVLAQNPMFCDNSGAFNPDAVREFAKSVADDESGRARIYWNYLQNTAQIQQYYSKYGALFTSGNFPNALVVEDAVAANNTTVDLEYVFKPYDLAADTAITVSNSEIKKYYNDHKKAYKRGASRSIEYVVYEVVPSTSDITATSDVFEAAYNEFGTAENVKTFLLKNSDRQLSDYWYKSGELNSINREVNDFVFGAAKGVSPIIKQGNTFYAAKVVANANIADSVYVKHILLQGEGARKTADSLVAVIRKGASFSGLAALHSLDQGSAADGELGNIGWLTQAYMIPGFESVMTAETGKPFVLNTRYGTHVVLVSAKTKPIAKKQVAILEKTAIASKETFNEYYNKANTFATMAGGTIEGYNKAVDSLGIYSHAVSTVLESTSSYGAIDQAKEVTRWVYDNKKGKVSNIITVNNNFFFVVALKDVRKEGYTPINEVAPGIRYTILAQKRADKAVAEAKALVEGCTTLQQVAEALGTSVIVKEGAALGTTTSSIDPALAGAALASLDSEIAGPVASEGGIYVLKVTKAETGNFYTETDAKNYELQKTQYASQQLFPVMMEAAEVEDNRARFF